MSKEQFNLESYPFTIRPLSREDGGGFIIEYPDIPELRVRRRNSSRGDSQ